MIELPPFRQIFSQVVTTCSIVLLGGDHLHQAIVVVMQPARPIGFVRWLEYRLAADGPIFNYQAKSSIEEGPLFNADRTEGCEAKTESLVVFDLICLGTAILIQNFKSELTRPAGAAE